MNKLNMHTVKKSKSFQVAALASVISFSAISHGAGLEDEMNDLFGSMSNYSAPGVYESQTRGAISGGRFTVKNKLYNENLVSLSLPSAKGGCGGIDLYGGSFSFINSDQLVQLLRSVAANAKGYAFQLALNAYAPDISGMISKFQEKLQKMNALMSNSCQLAKGILNETPLAKHANNAEMVDQGLTISGMVGDVFDLKAESDGNGGESTAKTAAPELNDKYLNGNIAWKALKRNQVDSWFGSGNEAMLRAMMSLTGSVIVKPEEDDANGNKQKSTVFLNNTIGLKEFVYGGGGTTGNPSLSVYNCPDGNDENECLGATPGNTSATAIVGFKSLVTDSLNKTILLYTTNAGSLTDEDKAFLVNMPQYIGTSIRNLSIHAPGAATAYSSEASDVIALYMANVLANNLIDASITASATIENVNGKTHIERMLQRKSQISDEYQRMTKELGSVDDLISKYERILRNVPKRDYSVYQPKESD